MHIPEIVSKRQFPRAVSRKERQATRHHQATRNTVTLSPTATQVASMLHQRRSTRKMLETVEVDKTIVERFYQHHAIRRVGDAFESKQRHALLVMATGSGKTRTVIALIDQHAKEVMALLNG